MKEDEIDYECGCVLKKGDGPWYVELFCPEHDPSIKQKCAQCRAIFRMSSEGFECLLCHETVCKACRSYHFGQEHPGLLDDTYEQVLNDNFRSVIVD